MRNSGIQFKTHTVNTETGLGNVINVTPNTVNGCIDLDVHYGRISETGHIDDEDIIDTTGAVLTVDQADHIINALVASLKILQVHGNTQTYDPEGSLKVPALSGT